MMLKVRSGGTLAERLAFYSRSGKNGCRVWIGHIDWVGYGRIQYEMRHQRAHRLAWQVKNGSIPKGLKVLHSCDNRRCVNPDHLFVGTQKDNLTDMFRKGRKATKLTPHEVRQIRKAVGTHDEVGRRFGISGGQARRIRLGLSWVHI